MHRLSLALCLTGVFTACTQASEPDPTPTLPAKAAHPIQLEAVLEAVLETALESAPSDAQAEADPQSDPQDASTDTLLEVEAELKGVKNPALARSVLTQRLKQAMAEKLKSTLTDDAAPEVLDAAMRNMRVDELIEKGRGKWRGSASLSLSPGESEPAKPEQPEQPGSLD